MIKLSSILLEKEDDGYVSIGFGRFKKKGQEDKDDADVYVKTDKGQFVKTKDQSSDDKGDDSEKKEKPKVNIFDKPKGDGPNPKSKDKPLVNKDDVYTDGEIETIVDKDVDEIKAMLYGKNPLAKYMSYKDDKRIQQHLDALKDKYNMSPYEEDFHKDELFAVMSRAQQNMEMGKVKQGERFSGNRTNLPKSKVGTTVKDGKIKSSGPQQFADDVKNMKGEFDLGGAKIKDGKMFDADGNQMDSDEIEDFYYQDAFDEKGNNVGIDVKDEPKDEPKKAKRKSVQLDFALAKNQAELERIVKKAGLDVKNYDVDINPNGDLTAKVTGDEETLRKFMTSDEYGMDAEDVDAYMDEYGEDAEDDESETESKPYSARNEIDDAIDQGDGDTAMELFQSEVGFKKMGKDGKEAKKLLDRLADYEYGLIDLDDEEQDDIKGRLKQLSNKHLGGDEPKDEPKAEPQSSNEAPVSGEPKVESSEMEDILMATLDDVGFGGQDTSGLEDIIYTYEDDLKEAGVLDDVEDDLYILQQIQSDNPSNPEDIPYEERERAVDRVRRKFEQADIIAESVKHSKLRELSKITTRYNK